jgi:hypothetical protein
MMSYQWLMVSKYRIMAVFGHGRSTSSGIGCVADGAECRATAPPALILRMARLSPKVQRVALVGSGQPDA